jgi:nitrous oxidase accessory protein NosD
MWSGQGGKPRVAKLDEGSLPVIRVPIDAETIEAALARHPSGGCKVVVMPGIYDAGCIIDKPNVVVMGQVEGSEVVQVNSPIVVKSDEVTLRTLTVRCATDAVAVVEARSVRVEECDLSAGRLGLLVRDSDSVVAQRNHLHECGCHGAGAFYSSVSFTENFCSLNTFSGIVLGACTGEVRANGLHQNGEWGIRGYKLDASLVMQDNGFEQNGLGEVEKDD